MKRTYHLKNHGPVTEYVPRWKIVSTGIGFAAVILIITFGMGFVG